jgi:hypothetical protein
MWRGDRVLHFDVHYGDRDPSTCTTFTTWLDAGAARSGKCQRSSAAAWTPSPAQLIEVIEPHQEMTRIRSKFLAYSGR